MNSLKSVFVVGVLASLACGVYWSLNRAQPDANPPGPPSAAQGPVTPPKVELPAPSAGGSYAGPTLSFSPGPASLPSAGPLPSALPGGPPPGVADRSSDAAPAYVPSSSPQDHASTAPPTPDWPGKRPEHLMLASDTPNRSSDPARDAPVAGGRTKFDSLFESIKTQMDEGRLADAHLTLSSIYGDPDVPRAQVPEINRLLDQMAAAVIYSRRPLLEPAYRVQPGDTLERIAESYKVPPQLIARINGIRDPQNLVPNRDLKVVRGPFDALINLERYELTLILQKRYAGRFAIGIGSDQPRLEGTYEVRDKRLSPVYNGPGGAAASNDPKNPLGQFYLDLGNNVGIHGTNDPRNVGKMGGPGTICLGDRDIDDVYGILSIGSKVIIQR